MTFWQKIKQTVSKLFGYSPRINPTVVACKDRQDAEIEANIYANANPPALIYPMLGDTGSMVPLIPKHGCSAVGKPIPFADVMLGTVVVYRPDWNNKNPVVHRLVAKDKLGFLASGDSTPRTESWERVTADNFSSVIVSLYTFPAT